MARNSKTLPLLVGAALLSAACHGPLKPGLDALAEGNYPKAEKHARSGLQKDRQDPDLNLLMADALVGEKKFKQALPYARRAYEAGAAPGPAARTLGKVLWEIDETFESLRVWRVAREVDPSLVPDADYIRALERAVAVAEKNADAETELEFRSELRSIAADHAEATDAQIIATRERVAETLVREGNYEAAIAVYEALSAEREQPKYPFERGRLLARLGEDKRAIAAFEQFIAIGDADGRPQRIHDVAVKAETIGAFSVAVYFYEEAIKALPNEPSRGRARIHRRVGGLLLSTGIKDLGERHLRAYVSDMTAVGGDPVSAEVYISAATVATGNRHPDLALELLEEATTKAGPSWSATRRLVELYARRAKTQDVERVLRTYVDRASNKSNAKIVVGEWAANRRNFELARFFLESAVSDDPGVQPDVWLQLARVYSALGYLDEVRRCLNTYATKSKDKRRAQLDVATIYRAQRMYDEAEKALKSALKSEPEDLLVVKLLEDLYREWGRPKKIHEVYDTWAKVRGNKPGDFQLVGERFFRQQEWDNALPYLIKAAKAGEHDAWLQVADIYNRQRKERDMKDALATYLSTSKDRARALNAVLQRYRVSNWNYEAIPILEELIKLEPRNLLHYEQLSQLYFEQGRDVEAFELWKRFIALADNPIAALETMARRFQRKKHQDWMLQFLHQVLERQTTPDPRLFRLLGDTYADLWASRSQQGASNAIFTQENKAKQYYARYLAEAKPSHGELQSFAQSMQHKRYWTIAARAYEQLNALKSLQSHQMLNYGIVLLNLGQADEAEAQFRAFYESRQKSVDAATAISDHLYTARRYVAVEPYLRAMMQEGEEAVVRQAFMRLAEVYRNSDQTAKIPALIADFLDRAQDPQEARRSVQVMLEAAGMWDAASQQLETLAELQEEAGFELGQNLFRAGHRDRADDAFRDYAAQNLNPAEAWARVAEFYEARGAVEKARNAFQNAANAAPQSEIAHAELGRYLIITGRIDEGRAAFERARSNVPHGQRGSLYRTEVEALNSSGHLAEARQAAREALGVAYLDREFFYGVLAPAELGSGDPVRSQRMVDELTGANLPLGALVALLRNAGYLEEAAALIDKEVVGGDHILGGDVLLTNASMFGAIGGISRLMRSAQPLLERTNRDPRVPRELGAFLVREGHLERGAMLLRQALELGDTSLSFTLAELYASLGHHSEAFEMVQADLAAAPDSARRVVALNAVGYRYEVLGERERFRELLEHLTRDDRFAADAIPYLIRYLTEDGEVALVVETVERLTGARISEAAVQLDDQAVETAIAALIAGVEELAVAGFGQEAMSLLASARPDLAERDQVRDLRLRMAAFGPGNAPEAEFNRALAELSESSAEASWQRLRVAELALAAGRYAVATEISKPALDSPDFGVSSRALRIALRSARAANDLTSIDATVAKYMAQNADKMSARATAHSELTRLGLDRRALLLAEEQATKVPIYSYVRDALIASQRFGDPARIEKWATRLLEVDRQNPNVSLQHSFYTWTLRQDDSLNAPLRKLLAGTYDQMQFGVTNEALNLYRNGEPFRARELLRARLEASKFDPENVEDIIATLSQLKLWGEVARVVARWVPPENLTVAARRLIGLANMSMGFDSDGLRELDQAVEAAPDAAHEATQIADSLLVRRRYDTALRYAELAVEKRPARPDGRRVRGLARLAVGDIDGAREDLDIALLAGLDRTNLLHRAAVIALRNGQDAAADGFLNDLLMSHDESHNLNGRRVFDAFTRAGKADEGITFFESKRPQIAAGLGLAGSTYVASLSQLYEAAGNTDRSFSVYAQGIRRLQFTNPLSSELATYRNNLAYGYSTTNLNVAEGFDLVRRAIAQNPDREPSYIDTLGWLHYREGDFKFAETEIRRAIRSSTGGTVELTELYHHLAVLRAAQGYHGESVWFQIFADSVEPMTD